VNRGLVEPTAVQTVLIVLKELAFMRLVLRETQERKIAYASRSSTQDNGTRYNRDLLLKSF